MANPDHLKRLQQGVDAWNAWMSKNLKTPDLFVAPDLSGADLSGANLSKALLIRANLPRANLSEANLIGAYLSLANLSGADSSSANLTGADLRRANLTGANLTRASLSQAILKVANLTGACLSGANLTGANLSEADLRGADLSDVDLRGANLGEADLSGVNLSGANLAIASLVDANIANADLTGCRIYGVSAWRLKLTAETKQRNLIMTRGDEPEITVDDIEVAQFIYLLLHNQKIRNVIDTITSKVVLILGRFAEDRKVILDAIRDQLRTRNFLPVIFDFSIPASRDVTETVKVLAGLARFVIADITDATEVRVELHNVVRDFTSLPVQPILLRGQPEFVSMSHLKRFPWLLPSFEYDTEEHLLADLDSEGCGSCRGQGSGNSGPATITGSHFAAAPICGHHHGSRR